MISSGQAIAEVLVVFPGAPIGKWQHRDRRRLFGRRLREVELFDRDDAVEPGVEGFEDLAHPAGADGGHDLVRARARARLQ